MRSSEEKIQSGLAQHQSGDLETAAALYREVLDSEPNHPEALHLLGLVHHQSGNQEEALTSIQKAVQLLPDNPAFLYNLGVILQELGQSEEAVKAYREVVSLDPRSVSAWVNLGNMLGDAGRFSEAIECHHNALKLQPDSPEHLVRLGRSHRLAGYLEEALSHFARAASLDPGDQTAQSNLLFASQYEPGIYRKELTRRHRAWASRFSAPISIHEVSPEEETSSDTGLRIGFLSPDFGNHPVGIFLAPLLERLKENIRITTVCFNDTKKIDEFLTRNQAAANEWHDIAGSSDDELEKTLRDARLDVLIELTGHTDNNRLPVMARKPVPIQATWAGYVGTTGLEAIDYLLCDSFHCPDGSQDDYAETLLRFPCGYIPYEPPSYAPDLFTLPLKHNGYPTFGCLNNPTKLTAPTLALWGKVMRQHPESRLILKYKGMDDPAVKTRVLGLLQVQGISPDRVEMIGQSNHVEHLATFSRIDIALDPLPYSGGLSTCEAIWMGVPVVTLPGDTFASRHSLSHLSNAGLPETIAESEDHYLEIVQDLVAAPEVLAQKRAGMRAKVAGSPLCDLDAFASDFAKAMRLVGGSH